MEKKWRCCNKKLRIFLSTGHLDAEKYLTPLEKLYQNKGYEVEVLHTQGGHDFKNWNEQIKEMLLFLAGEP